MGRPATASPAVALLVRSLDRARAALDAVDPAYLDTRTPCRAWCQRDLLLHLDDGLVAFAEVARGRAVAPPGDGPVGTDTALVDRVRSRADDLRGLWLTGAPAATVLVGPAALDRDLVVRLGALELAVHGWDLDRSTGVDHPLPDDLADDLLRVAHEVVDDDDRPGRFAPARTPRDLSPGARLLGLLGR